jgi:hypothetical protein
VQQDENKKGIKILEEFLNFKLEFSIVPKKE